MWEMSFYFAAGEGRDDTSAQFSERSGSESRGERDWVSETTSAGTTEHNRRSVQGISISSHRDVQTCFKSQHEKPQLRIIMIGVSFENELYMQTVSYYFLISLF